MYHQTLKNLFTKLNTPPDTLKELLQCNKYILSNKGYGTPEMEIRYIHTVFRHIQSYHPWLETFSWTQCNRYNDNDYHFELSSFTANGTLDVVSDINFYFQHSDADQYRSNINLSLVDDPNLDEKEYADLKGLTMRSEGLEERDWDGFWAYQ